MGLGPASWPWAGTGPQAVGQDRTLGRQSLGRDGSLRRYTLDGDRNLGAGHSWVSLAYVEGLFLLALGYLLV